jgi:hypothetical protein
MNKIILTVCMAIVISVCVFNRGSEAVIYQSGGNYAITIDSFINMLLSYNAHVDTLFNVPALAVWANDDSVLVNNLRKMAEADSVKINNLRKAAERDSSNMNTVLNNYHSKSTVKDSLQSNGLYPTYLTKTTVTTKYLGITPVTAMSDTTGWTGIHLFTFTGDTLYIYKADHTVIAK